MQVNQAVIVTDKNHPKFNKGGIILFVTPKPKMTDWQPSFIIGFSDGVMYCMDEEQVREYEL